jgi:FtsP/CotA-like multicopper oxidase with cupredoxin domain
MQRAIVTLLTLVLLSACAGSGTNAYAPPLSPPAVSPAIETARTSNQLPEPPEVNSVRGVATVSLTARINPATTLPEFVYDDQTGVAPTIRVHAGDTIVVDVADDLPSAGGMGADMNLHFHGLTVSPNPPADDVLTTLAMPGRSLHYVVPIPTSQQPGLYWYHPHVLGETDFQAGQAGMSGAIVVDGLETRLPALKMMKERLIVIRDPLTSVAHADAMRPHDIDTNNNPCGPDPGFQVTLNGAARPTIPIAANEPQFFRVVNATGHKNLNLSVDGAQLEIVAVDGYALGVYPGTPATEAVSSIVVPPAARIEFVVRGPASGTAEFRTLCYNSGPTGDPDPEVILADLRSTPAEKASAAREPHAPARLTAIGASPNSELSGGPIAAERTVVFSEDSNGFYINNQRFSMSSPPMFTVKTGTLEQWNVVNITQEVHDFHTHQVHFLVQQVNGNNVPHPYWADSVVVPARKPGANGSWTPGSLKVLVDFRNPVIKGEFMFHCHILDHEDMGMMAKIRAI